MTYFTVFIKWNRQIFHDFLQTLIVSEPVVNRGGLWYNHCINPMIVEVSQMSALFRKTSSADYVKFRQRFRFYGSVQAVGFRWRAMQAAKLYGATGWVRNEYDGSVTMEIQGTSADIDAVIATLEHDDYIRIDRKEREDLPLDPEERSFRVAY